MFASLSFSLSYDFFRASASIYHPSRDASSHRLKHTRDGFAIDGDSFLFHPLSFPFFLLHPRRFGSVVDFLQGTLDPSPHSFGASLSIGPTPLIF